MFLGGGKGLATRRIPSSPGGKDFIRAEQERHDLAARPEQLPREGGRVSGNKNQGTIIVHVKVTEENLS